MSRPQHVHLLSFAVVPSFDHHDGELEHPVGASLTVFDDDFNPCDDNSEEPPVPEILVRVLEYFQSLNGNYSDVTREQLIEQFGVDNIHTAELLVAMLKTGSGFVLEVPQIAWSHQFGHSFGFYPKDEKS